MTQETTTFSSFNLSSPLLKALAEMNFLQPSPIQQETIPALLEGHDVIGLAQTGTGKTAAFALPLLQNIKPKASHTQALILAPTRELAIQVAAQIQQLAKHLPQIEVAVLCGGQDYRKQIRQLKDGAQIVVGTPGRVQDHLERKTLKVNNISNFILDEADEMLNMGFIDDIEAIFQQLPEEKQIALFSATMPQGIRKIAKNYLIEPVTIEIKMPTATVQSIEQKFLFSNQGEKPVALLRVLALEKFQAVIVFTRTKSSTEEVAQLLQQQGYRAIAIHGDITQNIRERIISQFKDGAIDILVATDVAARGLDVERVSHVINYDVPFDCETYVHRIGRTGRAGRSGTTILFVTPREGRILNQIERHNRQKIEKINIPDDNQIKDAVKQRFLDTIAHQLENGNLDDYYHLLNKFCQEHQLNPLEIAAALALCLNKGKSLHDLSDLPKLGKSKKADKAAPSREKRFNGGNFSGGKEKRNNRREQDCFRLDVGKNHGVKPGHLIGAIANEGGLNGKEITGLKIHADHATVELPKGLEKRTLNIIAKARVCGRPLNISKIS